MRRLDFKKASTTGTKVAEKCPHCGSTHFIKDGIYKGKQRYSCKECNRRFTVITGTITHWIKKPTKFKRFVNFMDKNINEFNSIQSLCKIFKLSTQTAFDWRHKYLESINNNAVKFTNKVQADDVNMDFSEKGRKGKKNPRSRGGLKMRGDHDYLAKVLVTIDSNNNLDLRLLKMGRVNAAELTTYYEDKMSKVKELETDEHGSFKPMAKKLKLNHVAINSKEHPCPKINSIASKMKRILDRKMNGVSTKYLQNYLNWIMMSSKVKKLGIQHNQWDEYVHTESNYKDFLTNHSHIEYMNPVKKFWKTAS